MDVLTLWDDELSSLFNACGVIFAFAHPSGLVLSIHFCVLMVNLSLGMVCETWFSSCVTFAFAWTWWFDITSPDRMVEA